LNPILNAGTEYWLDISSAATSSWWLDNNQGGRGPIALNQNGAGFTLLTGYEGTPLVLPAFRINGAPLAASARSAALAAPADAPEPSTLLVVISGILLYCPTRMIRNRSL
jgi:hypothetical protein